MAINWKQLLLRHGVDFVEQKHDIYVHCVWCGAADEGHHLGISLRGNGYGCWRNSKHRGKNPVRLLAALLNTSLEHAAGLLGAEHGSLIGDTGLHGKLKAMLAPKPPNLPTKLKFPSEFNKLSTADRRGTLTGIFFDYLVERGYGLEEIPKLAATYGLRYALHGPYRYRLIFPVHNELGLATWTGRTVTSHKQPRYLTLASHTDDGKNQALCPITDCVLWQGSLGIPSGQWTDRDTHKRKALLLCEGPFDAMRMDWFGRDKDVDATCLFGKVLSPMQLDTLSDLAGDYQHKLLLLDPDAELSTFAMIEKLKRLGFRSVSMRSIDAEDPADMSAKDFEKLMQQEGIA